MKRWIILAAILAFVVAQRLFLRFLTKKLQEQQSKTQRYFQGVVPKDDVRANTLDKWRGAGLYRKPRKTVLKSLQNISEEDLPNEPYEEITEFPQSLEEAFEGLSNEEIEKILDIAQEKCYE